MYRRYPRRRERGARPTGRWRQHRRAAGRFPYLEGDDILLAALEYAVAQECELVALSELSDLGARVHRIAETPEGELIDDEAVDQTPAWPLSLAAGAICRRSGIDALRSALYCFYAQDQHLPR